jgi:hypothetical protein
VFTVVQKTIIWWCFIVQESQVKHELDLTQKDGVTLVILNKNKRATSDN